MNPQPADRFTLSLVLLIGTGAVWSIFNTQNRALRFLLMSAGVMVAVVHLSGQPLQRLELWWCWPLVIFIVTMTAMFALAALHSVGFL